MTFLEDLKSYLIAAGYADISRDTLPDKPDECIGLFVWAHKVPPINVGLGWRYVTIQVRRIDGDDAYATAFALFQLLDSSDSESGETQKPIQLTDDRKCIARPRSGPKKLSTDTSGRTIYYTEIAFKCKNIP